VDEAGGTIEWLHSTRSEQIIFKAVPSNQLETTLWLEADRMGFLLEAVNSEKFEIQPRPVKNERGRCRKTGLNGRVYKNDCACTLSGHPYFLPVIGYHRGSRCWRRFERPEALFLRMVRTKQYHANRVPVS